MRCCCGLRCGTAGLESCDINAAVLVPNRRRRGRAWHVPRLLGIAAAVGLAISCGQQVPTASAGHQGVRSGRRRSRPRRSADASSGVNRKSPSLMPKAWVTWTAPSGQLVEDRTGNARGGQYSGAEPGDGVVEGRVRQVFPG
jgi:hypothetical protein